MYIIALVIILVAFELSLQMSAAAASLQDNHRRGPCAVEWHQASLTLLRHGRQDETQ